MDDETDVGDELEPDDAPSVSPRVGRVAFAVIEALTLFGGPEFEDSLAAALVPGHASPDTTESG